MEKKPAAPAVEAEERHVKIRKTTGAVAQKFRDQLAERKGKADARHLELVEQAAVELLRGQFEQKAAPVSVKEMLAMACHLSTAVGTTTRGARSTRSTCDRFCGSMGRINIHVVARPHLALSRANQLLSTSLALRLAARPLPALPPSKNLPNHQGLE